MAKIAACLIVRNSAGTIERTLDSIRPFVDEINVFDTGSTDDTVSLLRQLNRKKILPWTQPDGSKIKVPLAPIRVKVAKKSEIPLSEDGLLGDFSWARDRSFEMVSDDVDWYFWLDDDDVIVGAEHLRQIAAFAHPSLDGFVMFYDYARDANTGQNLCALWRERLLRRQPDGDWGWRNAVHEVWLPNDHTGKQPNYMMLPPQQIRFVHERPDGRYPSTRNLTILERVVAEAVEKGEQPDPRTKAYMGTELLAHGRPAEAVPWLNAYIEDPRAAVGDERSQVYHKLGTCLRLLGQPLAAIEVEFAALKERDDWAENAAGLAEAFAAIGDWKRVETWAKRTLELGQPNSMLILNPLEFSFLPTVLLAQSYMAQRRFTEAAPLVQQALAMQPGHPLALGLAAGVEKDGLREEAVQAVLKLREILIRFDENWKAWELFDAIPYIVNDDNRIVAAKAMTHENVLHALEPDEYTRWYAEEPKESTVPDEWVPNAGDYIERAKLTLQVCERFEEEHGRKPRVLDLGCNDAWMLGYLWVKGEFVGDGIELNKASVEKAQGRIERFGIPGRIVQGNIFDAQHLLGVGRCGRCTGDGVDNGGVCPHCNGDGYHHPGPYDVVTCFEVYEHVPSTDALLDVMESLLTPEGVACVTTPNGAFEDGNISMWAAVERKGHLRAVTAIELGEQLVARGDVKWMNVHQEGRLTFAAWSPKPKQGKVILYAPGAAEPWSPESINKTGIGGSETALTYLALGLMKRNVNVIVYSDATPGVIGNTVWKPTSMFDPTEKADAVIVSRAPHAFDVKIHAPVRALWCHDFGYGDQMTPARMENITHVICLSEWEREWFAAEHPQIADKIVILRNGVSLESMIGDDKFPDAEAGFEARKPVCIYSSSADRGLDKLLEMWPAIRGAVPEAELHVYYGWETLDRMSIVRPDLAAFKAKILGLVDAAGGELGGVHMKGRIGQNDLYAAMQEARVWTYPTYFLETSCIGAMEARAAGLPIVTSDLGALKETVGKHGVLLDVGDVDLAPVIDETYANLFTGIVANLLTDEESWMRWHDRARDGVDEFGWDRRIDEWIDMIYGSPYLSPNHETAVLTAGRSQ